MDIENIIQGVYENLAENKYKFLIGSALIAGLAYYMFFINDKTKIKQKYAPNYDSTINYVQYIKDRIGK